MKKTVRLFTVLSMALILVPNTLFSQGNAINFQNLDYMKHGDFIYCGSPNYGFTNKFTIAAWIKWTTDPGSFAVMPSNHENEGEYSTYVAYGSHNSNNIGSDNGQFWLRNAKTGNKFEFLVENASNQIATASSSSNPSSGTWYFLAGVYDGYNIKLYVDGSLKSTTAQTGNIKSNDGTHRLNMGRLPWGYGFFVGYLDEVRIWKAALTQTEIQQQMASATTIRNDSVASYWSFNAGTGTVIDDSGPQNADGIFYTGAVDVHLESVFADKVIDDGDKTWVVNNWAGCTLKTVSGAGIDETNTIVSNTATKITVQYGFNGEAPDNKTTPITDSKVWGNDTWFGVEKSGETSQWVVSDAPLPVELTSFTAQLSNRSVVLNWQTATEVNNYGFEVERKRTDEGTHPFSSSPAQWLKVGFVFGCGTSNSPREYTFTDSKVPAGRYAYRLKQIDHDGAFEYFRSAGIEVGLAPKELSLGSYPNPFNPTTTIEFTLAEDGFTTLKVFDMLGREVVTLVHGELKAGIRHEAQFDASRMASGIYFSRLESKGQIQVKKLVLSK